MAIVSSFTLIKLVALFHGIVGFYLIFAPNIIAEHNFVWMMGEALGLRSSDKPETADFTTLSGPISFLAVLFCYFAALDFCMTPPIVEEEQARNYWTRSTPLRLALLFMFSCYIYLTKEGGLLGSKHHAWGHTPSPGDYLRNRVIFTWAFTQMLALFWVYALLGEESKQVAERQAERRMREE
ncbi:hypothetical protein NA57DRAFT_56637 [Rhizodiscina lignyota]|uniref:Increased loss of mitochondrial DNA protein 1 n=1 Tax=Rhizodiscina lignyota TaxID=1504668 RepID=A0A9P4IG55_9PEZI|nr:hypothetical protein NA57DRAFT_56637 [Rhizodiscina lignyota]